MDNFGISFSPTNQPDRMGQGSGQPSGSFAPVQQAIRTLSYKIPRVTGGHGLAPDGLLQALGSAGVPHAPTAATMSAVGPQQAPASAGQNPVMAGLEQWLRMFFANQGAATPSNAAMGSTPSNPSAYPSPPELIPNIVPGSEGTPRRRPGPTETPGPGDGPIDIIDRPGTGQVTVPTAGTPSYWPDLAANKPSYMGPINPKKL